jgi:hypothetical protein
MDWYCQSQPKGVALVYALGADTAIHPRTGLKILFWTGWDLPPGNAIHGRIHFHRVSIGIYHCYLALENTWVKVGSLPAVSSDFSTISFRTEGLLDQWRGK